MKNYLKTCRVGHLTQPDWVVVRVRLIKTGVKIPNFKKDITQITICSYDYILKQSIHNLCSKHTYCPHTLSKEV